MTEITEAQYQAHMAQERWCCFCKAWKPLSHVKKHWEEKRKERDA